MKTQLDLNTILQIGALAGVIVSGTFFVADIKHKVQSLEADNQLMHANVREFMGEERRRDEKQDAALIRFADKIDKRLDAIESRSAYCSINQKG